VGLKRLSGILNSGCLFESLAGFVLVRRTVLIHVKSENVIVVLEVHFAVGPLLIVVVVPSVCFGRTLQLVSPGTGRSLLIIAHR